MINKLKKHYKQGTLLAVIKNILLSWLPNKKQKQSPARIIGRVTESLEEAIEFLVNRISDLNKDEKTSLLVGEEDLLFAKLINGLNGRSVSFQRIDLNRISSLEIQYPEKTGCIFTSYMDAKTIHKIGEAILNNKSITGIPFEYVCIPKEEYSALEKYDDYNSFSFVSPLLISGINCNELYERSLDLFELRTPYFRYTAKCDIRDFMDLVQIISNVVHNKIDGDIAEFGSYNGHSGFLMSELLRMLGSEKTLYMFDTFEEFPKEDIGIDSFWSNTHKVDFDEVKRKLEFQVNVKLVKGDFTETLPEQPIEKLSFIYVDCDSYRATKFLMEYLYDSVLSEGGFMVFEDYGHPALLGNRLAIHQFFDDKKDCNRFFSQFSGYYIVTKL
jgi:predicted O-methyltransferase YrrM